MLSWPADQLSTTAFRAKPSVPALGDDICQVLASRLKAMLWFDISFKKLGVCFGGHEHLLL